MVKYTTPTGRVSFVITFDADFCPVDLCTMLPVEWQKPSISLINFSTGDGAALETDIDFGLKAAP